MIPSHAFGNNDGQNIALDTNKRSLIAGCEIDIFRPEYMFNKGVNFCRI